MQIYVVKSGDSVDSIASEAGIPVSTLLWNNQIAYPYRLAVGQALLLDNERNKKVKSPLHVSGYAYPFINPETLYWTIPYLTDLSVFSYGFTTEGNLIPPMADDSWMVKVAAENGVRPVLTLTPMGEDGKFNNNLVTALVQNYDVQKTLIWELGWTMTQKGYGGVDIDFEYVLADDRVEYAEFVKRVRQVMNLLGYQVSVTLAPKTSGDQRGILYEGIDYRLLGEAANRVLLMTYEWGYT